MGVFELIVVICLIACVGYVAVTYLPIDAMAKKVIGVIVCLLIILVFAKATQIRAWDVPVPTFGEAVEKRK